MESLNTLKAQKDHILNNLVHIPDPIVVYGVANELCSKLHDETIKNKFMQCISKTWLNTTT